MRMPVLVWLMSAAACAQGQASDTLWVPRMRSLEVHDEVTVLAGYHQGRYGFGELGIGRNLSVVGHFPVGWGYYLGGETRVDQPELMGVKVGCYATSGFAMGAQLIQYFEGDAQSTVLRPEIGLGVLKGKMTYAYNIGLSPERLPGINTHMISFSYAFCLLRLPGDDDHRSER